MTSCERDRRLIKALALKEENNDNQIWGFHSFLFFFAGKLIRPSGSNPFIILVMVSSPYKFSHGIIDRCGNGIGLCAEPEQKSYDGVFFTNKQKHRENDADT